MLKIAGTEKEIKVVGEIFNSVLELLGGSREHDGFGYDVPKNKKRNVTLSNVNGNDIIETLELIRDSIRLSYKNKGIFSQKEDYLEDCWSR